MAYSPKAVQPRISEVWNTLAPTGGINDTDPLANMEPQYCLELINWFPGNAALISRKGYREWATNLGGTVRTIMTYYDMSGDTKIFAATDGGIFDVTTSTDAPTSTYAVGNGRYKFTMFGTVANQYLVAVNGGSDPSLFFDGTSWNQFVQVDPAVDPGEIKGVDPSTFSNVTAFKRRLWFVQDDSMTAWYLPVDAMAGEAKPFYLTGVFKRGGKLSYIIDWSVDAGDGLDDMLVFVADTGEVVVYQGDDPDNELTWSLNAVFYGAPPKGDRSFAEVGGDIMMLTSYGVVELTKVLAGLFSQNQEESTMSKRINRTLNRISASRKYGTNWEIYAIQSAQALLVCIPPNGVSAAQQFVMNLLTGAWTRYDLPIVCAGGARGDMYFGTDDGRVCIHGEEQYLDNVSLDGTGGVPILCSLFTSFTYMDDPTVNKHWKLLRPLFQASKSPNYLLRINTDFSTAALPGVPAPPPAGSLNPALWDEAKWDQAVWSDADAVYRPWVGVSALGFCCALLMKVSVASPTSLVALEYVYEKGEVV